MIILKASEDIELKQIQLTDVNELFQLVNKNRDYLREFLPWLDKNQSQSDTKFFIKNCNNDFISNGCVTFVVLFKGQIVGVNGFHKLDKANKSGSIGYWLSQEFAGKGITTLTTRKIIQYGFEKLQLNRIVIRCATGNLGSNQVAKKLGLKFEGIAREAEWLYDHYVDHNIYSILKTEF